MATQKSIAQLRAEYRKYANNCVGKVNSIRRMVGRNDRYTLREFTADTLDDLRKAGVSSRPTPAQWTRAARSRWVELGR